MRFELGLTDRATEDTFLWPDGSAPTYAPWVPGQPNDGAAAMNEASTARPGAMAAVDMALTDLMGKASCPWIW